MSDPNHHHHHHHHDHQGHDHHHHHHHHDHNLYDVKQVEESKAVGLGIGPYKIPVTLYQKNRLKVVERFKKIPQDRFTKPGKGALFFQGGDPLHLYDTDVELLFRQESFFYYLFGLNEPSAFGAIDLQTSESLLFLPRPYEEYELWQGKVQPLSSYKEKYGVDHAFFTDEMAKVLNDRGIQVLHVIAGTNSDSRRTFVSPDFAKLDATHAGMGRFTTDASLLYWEIVECRVHKTAEEVALMKYVNDISSAAHKQVMRKVRPGMFEYQLEGIFRAECAIQGGIRYVAYTCICCTGKDGSVLHYGHAGAPLTERIKPNDMLLLDMGGDYNGYVADITCSFPASGKFSPEHREVYEMVYDAQQAVIQSMKPGVLWPDMHRLAERVILEHLVRKGFVNAGAKSIEELRALGVAAVFFPHGLGHLLGLDVHDVGGFPPGVERLKEPGIRKLRTCRALEEGMVLTVEPGVYFIDANIDRASAADSPIREYLNLDKINKFRNFGGVRLEDDVLVTASGAQNLTTCPRSIEDIEKLMAETRAHDCNDQSKDCC